MNKQQEIELLGLVLPSGILEFFTITQVVQSQEHLDFSLEELNLIPQEYINDKVTSKGFYEEIKVQDYPIRGKSVFLHIKRRRWLNESTGDIIFRDWELVAKGTRMTKEFASFLKVISGYQTGKL